ncbi:MAG: sigma-70 family RNA polymerase sigma factor [Deltaproteobacteria bacterium]|nr:sigma-70 family RNA polymerase sigma factor [Nannocystaceae bacterium]
MPKSASVTPLVGADDDEAMLRQAFAGDRTMRRTLAARLLDPIQREVTIALLRASPATGQDPRQEVRDIVQDVLVLLFDHDARELRRWDPLRGRTLESFVRLIARRRVARVLSQRRGHPWALVLIESELEDPGEGDAELIQELERRNQLDTVWLALQAGMGERDHELFEFLFVQEQDPADVCEALGMTRAALHAWSYRMRKLARAIAARIDTNADATSSTTDTTTSGGVGRGR